MRLMEEFTQDVAHTRSLATVRAYTSAVRAFLTAAPPEYEQAWTESVSRHLQRMRDAGRSDSTCDQALAALDAFGEWRGLGMTGVARWGKPTPVPKRLTAGEAELAYGHLLRASSRPEQARALAALLLTTATKLGDALAMSTSDVNPRAATARVARGKMAERGVVLHSPLVALLRPLIAGGAGELPLFRNSPGTKRARNVCFGGPRINWSARSAGTRRTR
jgi:integrase